MIAKLCSFRDTDKADVESEAVRNSLDWDLLNTLQRDEDELKASILGDYSIGFLSSVIRVCGEVATMRKLTFERLRSSMVAELSRVQTATSIKLANRMAENLRLKEPLFLYALTFDKVELLLRYTANSAKLRRISNSFNRHLLAQIDCFWKITRIAGRSC